MTTFIFDVLQDLKEKNVILSDVTFILPSKRAGIFLKHQLPKVIDRTIFSPEIISVEEFVETLSQIKPLTNTELLFELYATYTEITHKKDLDSFDSFSKWAQILIQDFNEIDRHLIPQENIFNYLSAIQDLKHWSLEEDKTTFVKNYLSFWNHLHQYYEHFTKCLKGKKRGYQGLIYREAVRNLEAYIENNPDKKLVFLGFNALNTAEKTIIQTLLERDLANIYWDMDQVFMDNPNHAAALFVRHHKKWPFFENHAFDWIGQNYSKDKNIAVYGIPKNIGQAKHIGSLLLALQKTNPNLQNTAVVLSDESLLIPVLNSLPQTLTSLNITMGFPLESIPMAMLFETLFQLHKTPDRFYYKEVIAIISNQYIRPLFYEDEMDLSSKIQQTIEANNLVYLDAKRLLEITQQKGSEIIQLLFSNWSHSVDTALQNCLQLILTIKNQLNKNTKAQLLNLEYAFRFNELFNELIRLNSKYQYLNDIPSLYRVYKELLSHNTLDFQGEPLQGLQIMGMLESRVLDFETVIIASVNEGVLPLGKTNNSFIPFDVKLENKLPTYKEKDAIYTYHFYHLLQRAKEVHILYNTEADVLTGGEKSRFITQLELEGIHSIRHEIITPQVPIISPVLNRVQKTPSLQKQIISLAELGFSPSSLTNYIRNPIDFYYQKVLKIKQQDQVEETLAANTLGTVVHNTLEDLYKPLVGIYLTSTHIDQLQLKIEARIRHHFQNEYKEGDMTKGKNLIIFEIAKRYVSNFLDLERKGIKAGDTIKIIALEAKNDVILDFPELKFPVKIKGVVDRVDQCNGITRIIDYKTGSVQQNQVEIVDWNECHTDYKKYSKSFQVLCYALMMFEAKKIQLPIEAGVISFKNLQAGVLKFAKKESEHSRQKDTVITKETLTNFKTELQKLIVEICNPEIDFIEKEVS